MTNINDMVGKTMVSVVNHDNEELVFTSVEGTKYVFYHCGDCCESVTIEDVCGDLSDLEGLPLIVAEEISSDGRELPVFDNYDNSETWTFYRFATAKGFVTVRWYGTSNGFYSESVDFRVDFRVENA
jgi:hypothetical protein